MVPREVAEGKRKRRAMVTMGGRGGTDEEGSRLCRRVNDSTTSLREKEGAMIKGKDCGEKKLMNDLGRLGTTEKRGTSKPFSLCQKWRENRP